MSPQDQQKELMFGSPVKEEMKRRESSTSIFEAGIGISLFHKVVKRDDDSFEKAPDRSALFMRGQMRKVL